MTWVVGRDDAACYVEEREPIEISGHGIGEQAFATEREAFEYALMCDLDALDPLRRNVNRLRAHLRKLERVKP